MIGLDTVGRRQLPHGGVNCTCTCADHQRCPNQHGMSTAYLDFWDDVVGAVSWGEVWGAADVAKYSNESASTINPHEGRQQLLALEHRGHSNTSAVACAAVHSLAEGDDAQRVEAVHHSVDGVAGD